MALRTWRLVNVDKKRMNMDHALVLADNRGRLPKKRVSPPPDVVDKIADDLGLEGDAREPVWYKMAYASFLIVLFFGY
ncbi:hypothetical protein GLOTRDRAFT_134619 [Gloeophyllum trabeum ATCC 11539]|uniref:Uncharacterized protein n=1 Tax=Gloeophyllum trabeum (strain ATCC 11539 / FP-39264 / Madison 617) TaxID=670483 RepID=S7PQY1_GLOTA|nr:uncharacterized protein GLOTRDRAFT_134619 [Gloeophyllum trabeum ATCC 11539]EPQ49782.1 hypothetical protein GLOTRDRAFT_134619 [Gloeophyllum trabeum ATCC 11539]